MRRRLLLFGCLVSLIIAYVLIWAATTPPSSTIIEEHVSSESSSYLGKYLGHQLRQAQQFYLDNEDAQPVSGIGLLLKAEDYGSPAGDIAVAIYDNAQGDVPGNVIDGSEKSFTPVLGQWNYVSYDQQINLNTGASNKYWIVATIPDQAGDNDAYCWNRSTTNTYDRGYRKTFNSGGSNAWETKEGDFAFQVYGDPILDVNDLNTGIGNPEICRLYGNYPNPFNPVTTIRYSVSAAGGFHRTVIRVYDILGHEVATLVGEIQSPGENSVIWDGCDTHGNPVSSGIYLYRLFSAGESVETRRMVKME